MSLDSNKKEDSKNTDVEDKIDVLEEKLKLISNPVNSSVVRSWGFGGGSISVSVSRDRRDVGH